MRVTANGKEYASIEEAMEQNEYRDIEVEDYEIDRPIDEANSIDGKRKQIGGNHYAKHTIQPWDIIREYELDFFEGSCISYILRRKNNRLEDLQKAAHYLEECIKNEQKRIDNV